MNRTADTKLRGSIVPLVTPFSDGAIDTEAFEASVERQFEHGSHGVVVTGTTGEPTSLTLNERADLYRRAVASAADRITVVAATGTANSAETIELTRRAERLGVDAVLVVCPAFVKPSQDGLVEHFVTVAQQTDLPVLIYNIPGRSAVGLTAETIERTVERAPSVVGVKHASNDLDLVTDLLLRLGTDFRLFCGLESYSFPFLSVGGAGLMSAIGNLLPGPVAELCQAVAAGDHDRALLLHRALFRVNQAVFYDTNPGPLKAMLAAAGLGSDEVRPPLIRPSAAVRDRVLEALATVDQLLGVVSARDR